jgi:copper homeostasis protein
VKGVPVEICVDCSEVNAATASILAALEGGASRVELCAEMSRGGLTPGPEYCRIARQLFGERRGVLAMIRPHAEGFRSAPFVVGRMCESIERLAAAGADGVVFGPLDANGAVDTDALGRLSATARELGVTTTFHRAFDALADPMASIPLLVDHGIARVLTTGTPWGSGKGIAEGLEQVRRVIAAAAGRIEVVCAGRIGPGCAGVLRPLLGGENLSVHSYSGVLRGGRVDAQLVRELTESLGA